VTPPWCKGDADLAEKKKKNKQQQESKRRKKAQEKNMGRESRDPYRGTIESIRVPSARSPGGRSPTTKVAEDGEQERMAEEKTYARKDKRFRAG